MRALGANLPLWGMTSPLAPKRMTDEWPRHGDGDGDGDGDGSADAMYQARTSLEPLSPRGAKRRVRGESRREAPR